MTEILTHERRWGKKRIYALAISLCIGVAVAALIVATRTTERDGVHSVILNGSVVLGYSNSVPTSVVFENNQGNYSAVSGDTSGNCDCAGYYYMVTLPNYQTYTVSVYYKSNNATHVCQTQVAVFSTSAIMNDLIRCP